MLEKAVDGVEIVHVVRKNWQERLLIRSLRKIYYRTLRNFSIFNLQNHTEDFVLISSRIAMSINNVQDQNLYVRGMTAQTGARFESVSYTINKRIQEKVNTLLLCWLI